MRPSFEIPLPGRPPLFLGPRTLVMGVVNVTPDSFSDGGERYDTSRAVEAALAMEAEGADVIDVGGETTRPGAKPVDALEERRRVLPVVEALAGRLRVPLSIDTYKAEVADAALSAGATVVNDISGLLYDPELGSVVARWRAGLVLMHMRGRSSDMYRCAEYEDLVADVARELGQAMARARAAGVSDNALILDPGIGFAKRAEHSWRLLANLSAPALAALRRPWLVGPSRKSFLTTEIGDVPPQARDWATAAAVAAAVFAGAHMVRVHRVAEMVQAVRVADRVLADRADA